MIPNLPIMQKDIRNSNTMISRKNSTNPILTMALRFKSNPDQSNSSRFHPITS